MTARHERETLLVFSDDDVLNEGEATLSTFREAIMRKCIRAGGRVVRKHVRDGKVEAWDLRIAASLVRIGFKSAARARASAERMRGQKPRLAARAGAKNAILEVVGVSRELVVVAGLPSPRRSCEGELPGACKGHPQG